MTPTKTIEDSNSEREREGEVMDVEASLESTPTWAIASVCSALILVALLIEHGFHLLTLFVTKRKRKTLNQAVDQIKAELRRLGFTSLLMTIAEQPISKICLPRSLGNTFLPCKGTGSSSGLDAVESGSCEIQGKLPLVSAEGMEQLQLLVFVLAVYHVLSCLLTLGLGEAKIKRWESWERETQTLEHCLSNDSRRFKLARQTSFGKRHLKLWSNSNLLLYLVCFIRQFADSISKADYFALRHAFIGVHFTQDHKFDFHKFLRRSLDQDFVTVVKLSYPIWIYAIFFIFFNAHGFYNHYWLPFIPLVILLVVGTKLQTIITTSCVKSSQRMMVVQGRVHVKLDDNLFWFRRPQLLLNLIHFVLVQNSFQLAFLTWSWYKFGFRSCYHEEVTDTILSFGIGILVQFLCAYVTLPLYALVSQMGSSMKKTIFTENIVKGLKNWHKVAKRNLSMKTNTPSTSSPSPTLQPLPCPRNEFISSHARTLRIPRFEYPSERRELIEVQRVAEKMIECSANNIPYDGEISFRLWRKKDISSHQKHES